MMYFMRSIDGQEPLKAKVPFIESLVIQVDLIACLSGIAQKIIFMTRIFGEVGVSDEFSSREKLGFVCTKLFEKYIYEIVSHMNEQSCFWSRRMENYVVGTIGECFSPQRLLE